MRTRTFNTVGPCDQWSHHMVDVGERLVQILPLVDEGDYLVLSASARSGKTTLLNALAFCLREDHLVARMNFRQLGSGSFESEEIFSRKFADRFVLSLLRDSSIMDRRLRGEVMRFLQRSRDQTQAFALMELFDALEELCGVAEEGIVLLIDEVDAAPENVVFGDFLAQLSAAYTHRMEHPAFRSVILAGVRDVRYFREGDGLYARERSWDVAADFRLEMNFSAEEIERMLLEYRWDRRYDFDSKEAAQSLLIWTGGQPYLTSRLCRIIDETLSDETGVGEGGRREDIVRLAWSAQGIEAAAQCLIQGRDPLLEGMTRQASASLELRELMEGILEWSAGELFVPWTALDPGIDRAAELGLIRRQGERAVIASRMVEEVLRRQLFPAPA